MFEKLREKLGGFKNILGGAIEETENEVINEQTPAKTPEKSGVMDRLKAAVLEQEFIISEKSLKDHLWELEVALLESDVALPVAEKIVESVKTELVGKRRKIGSDTGEIVESALKKALLKVISVDSFDFDEFIKSSKNL